MVFLRRRRLLFWLIKAYIKKQGKSIFLLFLASLILFTLLFFASGYIVSKLSLGKRDVIGVVGAYKVEQLPNFILSDLSQGLTTIGSDNTILPGIARSWQVSPDGKTYIFNLRTDKYFADGTNITSQNITYSFADVKIERPTKYVLIFTLKDSYAPFLLTVSRPIFKDNYIGTGNYKIKKVKLNGDFVESLTLNDKNDVTKTRSYIFFPSTDALLKAYVLGEVTKAIDLPTNSYHSVDLASFHNTSVDKHTNYDKLVSLFFNTQDSALSDKKLRDALGYALPDTFKNGERNYSPYPSNAWFANNDDTLTRHQDFTHASLLMDAGGYKKTIKLIIQTLPQYEETAKIIKASWRKINVDVTIQVVDGLPQNFSIFLGSFNVPKDPDQYILWHTGQPTTNITSYKNLRIDKLLEDGRKTIDITERKKIYADFQKYLIDDAPALFLYSPYEYTVIRK